MCRNGRTCGWAEYRAIRVHVDLRRCLALDIVRGFKIIVVRYSQRFDHEMFSCLVRYLSFPYHGRDDGMLV